MLCTCEARVGDPDMRIHYFTEIKENYGLDAEGNQDPRWTNNSLAIDTEFKACGRVWSSSIVAPSYPHPEGEVERVVTLAAKLSAPLEGLYIHRGDEGDHGWHAVYFPCLDGQNQQQLQGPVTVKELQDACGGALMPDLEFTPKPLLEEIERVRGQDEDRKQEGEVEAWESFSILCADLGVTDITYMYPKEPRGMRCSVYPHFVLGRTGRSLVGLFANTVWT